MAGTRGEDPEALAQAPGGLHLGRMELRCRCRWGLDSGDWDLGNGKRWVASRGVHEEEAGGVCFRRDTTQSARQGTVRQRHGNETRANWPPRRETCH